MPTSLLTEIEKKFWNSCRTAQDSQINSEWKKSIATVITTTGFKIYYRVILIKTTWYCHKSRHEDQLNKIENQNMNAHNYSCLTLDKDAQSTHWKKDSVFHKQCWGSSMSTCRKIGPVTVILHKSNFKWVFNFTMKS